MTTFAAFFRRTPDPTPEPVFVPDFDANLAANWRD